MGINLKRIYDFYRNLHAHGTDHEHAEQYGEQYDEHVRVAEHLGIEQPEPGRHDLYDVEHGDEQQQRASRSDGVLRHRVLMRRQRHINRPVQAVYGGRHEHAGIRSTDGLADAERTLPRNERHLRDRDDNREQQQVVPRPFQRGRPCPDSEHHEERLYGTVRQPWHGCVHRTCMG